MAFEAAWAAETLRSVGLRIVEVGVAAAPGGQGSQQGRQMTHDDIEKIAAARAVLKASVESLDQLLLKLERDLRTDAEEPTCSTRMSGRDTKP